MPRILVTNRQNGKQVSHRIDKDNVTIGRLPGNDVVLKGKTVSRQHAEISRNGDTWYIEDSKSGNGTLLKGKKLKPLEKAPLTDNDKFYIEDFEIKFILDTPQDQSDEDKTGSDIIEIKMIRKVLKALNQDNSPTLEVISSTGEGTKISFPPEKEDLVIGREAPADLVIASQTISRKHARLERKWGGITILDLESKNGVMVNNQKIAEKRLTDGDIISIGDAKILFRNPEDVNLEALSEEFEKSSQSQIANQENSQPVVVEPITPVVASAEPVPPISEQAKQSIKPEEPLSENIKSEANQQPVKTEESVKTEEPIKEKGPDKKKEKISAPPIKSSFFSRFSTFEKVVIGISLLVCVGALCGIYILLG